MKTGALEVGELVEVRSREEILRTLDKNGRLEGVPFMPEMLQHCGRRFPVLKGAHKTCDTVFPVRGRRLSASVHLDIRCDGSAHGGCQAACLIFWKEAWLKRPDTPVLGQEETCSPTPAPLVDQNAGCSERDLMRATGASSDSNDVEPTYVCQATRLPYFTTDLAWWDVRQYIQDYTSGNVTLAEIARGAIYSLYYAVSRLGIGLGRPMRWLYNICRPLWHGSRWPRTPGTIPADRPTPLPAHSLNLQAGDLVRVKSHDEILGTLNIESKNRGLYFDAEMVPYCGGAFRVRSVVTRIINEKTGKMAEMKTPSIILENAYCQSRYSHRRMFCPRAIYSYWREIWLERIPAPAAVPKDGGQSEREPQQLLACRRGSRGSMTVR